MLLAQKLPENSGLKEIANPTVSGSTPDVASFVTSNLNYRIANVRTGREVLTFVRSMMEWLGGTVSKEDVGEETSGKRNNKRRRDDDPDEESIGAFALRFK
jgi:hypothetical protein